MWVKLVCITSKVVREIPATISFSDHSISILHQATHQLTINRFIWNGPSKLSHYFNYLGYRLGNGFSSYSERHCFSNNLVFFGILFLNVAITGIRKFSSKHLIIIEHSRAISFWSIKIISCRNRTGNLLVL